MFHLVLCLDSFERFDVRVNTYLALPLGIAALLALLCAISQYFAARRARGPVALQERNNHIIQIFLKPLAVFLLLVREGLCCALLVPSWVFSDGTIAGT